MTKTFRTRVRETLRFAPPLEKRLLVQRSYSQEGEDRVLMRYFGYRPTGFYVDVGAHHPFRFSNTQLFYEMGWRGINVDAMPGSMRPFRRSRPRDINLEVGVDEVAATARLFVFEEPALNTFDEAIAQSHDAASGPIKKIVDVPVLPLRDILAAHLPPGQTVDFLSVDVEGRDLQVLRSNDWRQYRPKVVLAESLGKTLDDLPADPIAGFLRSVDYVPYAKTANTFMFIEGNG